MEKQIADKIITDYIKKIYGFALSKTMDIDLAEELSSRITFEVYSTLLKANNIHNLNSYIYRIARNVYSRFIIEEMRDSKFIKDEKRNADDSDISLDDSLLKLRNEISFLSNLQREIVIMYYFEKLKLKDISEKVNLKPGTVKWHLFEARNQIKDGFEKSINKTPLSNKESENTDQITFIEIKKYGYLGQLYFDKTFYFQKLLTQNIIYSVYRKPKTSLEIAKELSVPTAFIEDEITFLENNAFITKQINNKYISNMYLIEPDKEIDDKIDIILTKYSKSICDIYIPLLFEKNWVEEAGKIYYPANDLNFLMWSIVSYACKTKLIHNNQSKNLDDFMLKRKDGGKYFLIGTIGNYLTTKYDKCNDMVSSLHNSSFMVWQFFSKYDDKKETHVEWKKIMFENFYNFIKGNLSKEPSSIDKYMGLFDKGYIVSKGNKDYANIIVTTYKENELIDILPHKPEALNMIGNELDEELFRVYKKNCPEHKQALCREINKNSLTNGNIRIKVLENLLKKGVLKPVKKNQRKTVNMILFSDRLPEKDL